jgi:hypothetical protein
MAFCAVALTLTTQAVFHLGLRSELIVFIFCGTFFGYNLQRLPSAFENDRSQLHCWRHHWYAERRTGLTVLTVLAAIAFAWSASRLYLGSQTLALIPATLSFAYAFPVIPTRHKWIQLREIPGMKIFIIAITWACSCAMLPIVAAHRQGEPWISAAATLWALVYGLLVFAIAVAFDIRDLGFDAGKLKTLPALLGMKRSVFAAIGALIASAAITWFICRHMARGTGAECLAYAVWCLIASVFIYKSTPDRHEYYFSFFIDGLILLLWGMVSVAKVL